MPRSFGRCSRCKRTEKETPFGASKYSCKECLAAISREYHAAHREARNQRCRDYHNRPEVKAKMASPEYRERRRALHAQRYTHHHRAAMRLKNYGVTKPQYEALLVKQGGLCAICATLLLPGRGKTSIDHCHKTGVVRGLLCNRCNLALGHLDDNVERLEAAIAYLKKAMVVDDPIRMAA